jgi:hypothetical protein
MFGVGTTGHQIEITGQSGLCSCHMFYDLHNPEAMEYNHQPVWEVVRLYTMSSSLPLSASNSNRRYNANRFLQF